MILRNLHIVGEDTGPKVIKLEVISEIQPTNNSNKFSDDIDLNLKDCIAFPGLINSHDHLEFNLYSRLGHKVYEDYVEWGNDIHNKDKEIINSIESIPVELRLRYGILKNLLCGVTAVAHHGKYHPCLDESPISIIKSCISIHSVRLGGRWKLKLNFKLIKNGQYVFHIGEGINAGALEEIDELIRWNLFKKKLIGVHGIAMTEKQSKYFQAIVWCPVSNLFLFNKTADVSSLKKNTKILFGTDSTLTAAWNVFEHLRKARELNLLSDEELFSSITKTAAEAWEIKDCGKVDGRNTADIIIAKRKSEDLYESFYQTNPEDISLVIKKGKVILFDESFKEALTEIKNFNTFNRVLINGSVKFIDYNVSEVICQIKKYNINLPFS